MEVAGASAWPWSDPGKRDMLQFCESRAAICVIDGRICQVASVSWTAILGLLLFFFGIGPRCLLVSIS